jgi:hypothetical protein
MLSLHWRRAQPEPKPTTADLVARRVQEWQRHFPDADDVDAYRRLFPRHSPLPWHLVESTQGDLLALLAGRVPAGIGVPALFGLTVLFSDHFKAADASRATLAMIVHELPPAQARTLLATLADSWHNAEAGAYEHRTPQIRDSLRRALRRLASTGVDTTGVLDAIADQMDYAVEFREQ